MKCNNCGKREANVKYREEINGKKQELNLCSECAEKLGIIDKYNSFAPMFSTMFYQEPEFIEELKCDKCGYTLDDYKKTGLFGCDNCYRVFDGSIDNLLLKIHGKKRHVKKINSENNIEKLKAKLAELVKDEKYEEAAVIRDKIRKIEGK